MIDVDYYIGNGLGEVVFLAMLPVWSSDQQHNTWSNANQKGKGGGQTHEGHLGHMVVSLGGEGVLLLFLAHHQRSDNERVTNQDDTEWEDVHQSEGNPRPNPHFEILEL